MTNQLFACSAGTAAPLVTCSKLNRQGAQIFENFESRLDEGAGMQEYLTRRTFKNYRELIANELAEAVPHSLGN
jgi:hypothetical protein